MILQPSKIIPLFGVQHGMNIMDVGSSIGFWAKPLSEMVGNAGKIFAIDNHPEIIDRLNHDLVDMGIKNIYPINADIYQPTQLGVAPESCDKVLLVRMMDILDDAHQDIIKSLFSYLKPNGEIIIIDSMDHLEAIQTFLSHHRDDYFSEAIPLVMERTENNFFGFRIGRIIINT